jgi:hypothetical protein
MVLAAGRQGPKLQRFSARQDGVPAGARCEAPDSRSPLRLLIVRPPRNATNGRLQFEVNQAGVPAPRGAGKRPRKKRDGMEQEEVVEGGRQAPEVAVPTVAEPGREEVAGPDEAGWRSNSREPSSPGEKYSRCGPWLPGGSATV